MFRNKVINSLHFSDSVQAGSSRCQFYETFFSVSDGRSKYDKLFISLASLSSSVGHAGYMMLSMLVVQHFYGFAECRGAPVLAKLKLYS